MLKKISTVIMLGLGSLSVAQAGVFYVAPSISYESITSNNISYNGLTFRPVLGYGTILRDTAFYLGGEIFAGYKPWWVFNNNAKDGVSLKPEYSYGISVLPGYFFDSETLGFLRIGPMVQHFGGVGVTKTGFEVGAGLGYRFADCWVLNGEFDYMKYPSFAGITGPHEGQFTVALDYIFATV